MKERGWNLNILQEPASVHLCCTMLHVQPGVADRFIDDVKIAVKKVRRILTIEKRSIDLVKYKVRKN